MTKFLQSKYAHTFLSLLLLSVISLAFSACNNDEPESNSKDFLVGTWKYKFNSDGYVLYTFNKDGSGKSVENDEGEIDVATFSYIHYPQENLIKVFFDDEGDTEIEYVTYDKISDTRLIVYDFYDAVENWTKQ